MAGSLNILRQFPRKRTLKNLLRFFANRLAHLQIGPRAIPAVREISDTDAPSESMRMIRSRLANH